MGIDRARDPGLDEFRRRKRLGPGYQGRCACEATDVRDELNGKANNCHWSVEDTATFTPSMVLTGARRGRGAASEREAIVTALRIDLDAQVLDRFNPTLLAADESRLWKRDLGRSGLADP
jgi:hypothetical protein